MKHLQVKHILPMVAYSNNIYITDNDGLTTYAKLENMHYNGVIKACEQFKELYVVMILPYLEQVTNTTTQTGLEIVVSKEKYF